jgi:pre-rRNA-processing protein TSR3
MLAANPVNYGKEIKLTCAEALAGALYLSGFKEEAEQVMDCFKWGGAFFAINEIYLEKYVECQTSDEMFQA